MTEDAPRQIERLGLVARGQMSNAADGGVGGRTAQPFGVDILVGDRLHDVGAGHEHVARALDHDDVIGHRRGVHRAAGTRSEDDRDLRDDTGRQDVAQEDVGVTTERRDAFLDPRATRIVEADDRRPDLHRQIHDLADLAGVRLRQRPTEDREVLREDEHQPAVDRAMAGDDAVAEIVRSLRVGRGGPVGHERVELDERSRVEEQLEALAGRELAHRMLALDPLGSPTEQRLRAHPAKAGDPLVVRRHGPSSDYRNHVFAQGRRAGSIANGPMIVGQTRRGRAANYPQIR